MKMNNDVKCEEKLTCQFKIDMINLTNFDLSTQKTQKKIHFNGRLLTKLDNVWGKESAEELFFEGNIFFTFEIN